MVAPSKGYGLLWDKVSLLNFNPADQRIPLNRNSVSPTAGVQPYSIGNLTGTPVEMNTFDKKTGTFTTGEAGKYAFLAKDENQWQDFTIVINGHQVAGVTNIVDSLCIER